MSEPFIAARRRYSGGAPSDPVIVALAAALALGARWAAPVPLWTALVLAVVALVNRHPVLIVVAGLLMGSTLAARSWAGLESTGSSAVADEVTLVTDPVRAMGAVRAEVRLDGHRYDIWARGKPGVALEARSAGERVVLRGQTNAVEPNSWRASRHLHGRIVVDEVVAWSPGNLASRLANGFRGVLMRGARQLPERLRPLFGGFVLGDTRGQDPLVAEDFRQAGLSHLLVVSGSNVAFVLVVMSPLLARLGLRSRLAVTILVLVFFALVTRMEPSVLRATVMAGLAAAGTMLGRPQTSVRLLASAIVVLLLVDPLLVESMGFALSVAACVGIVFLARPISDALPGPRGLAHALGVTLGAQLGVSPVLLQLTNGVPVVTLVANLLTQPVAGFVMGWGMAAGIVAGLAPRWLAAVLHLPTATGLWWINSVARWSAAAPLGRLGISGLVILGVGTGCVIASRRKGRTVLAVVSTLATLALVVVLPGGGVPATAGGVDIAVGAVLWRAPGPDGVWSSVLVLDGRADTQRVLSALHEADVDRLDLVVVASASRTVTAVVPGIPQRIPVSFIWVGEQAQAVALANVATTEIVELGDSAVLGAMVVDVLAVTPKLSVEVIVPGTDALGTGSPGYGSPVSGSPGYGEAGVGSSDATAPDEVGAWRPSPRRLGAGARDGDSEPHT